jgi:hypothetical protein
VAGDCTRAYRPEKLACFTRQIVFIRPGTFIIFDRVTSRDPQSKKTWVLQAMKPPTRAGELLWITNGNGRLFIQTLLPVNPQIRLINGPELYNYGGKSYPPERDTGPAPECRIEVSPSQAATTDYFLHVLTAADSGTTATTAAALKMEYDQIAVVLGTTRATFRTDKVRGDILINGSRHAFTDKASSAP